MCLSICIKSASVFVTTDHTPSRSDNNHLSYCKITAYSKLSVCNAPVHADEISSANSGMDQIREELLEHPPRLSHVSEINDKSAPATQGEPEAHGVALNSLPCMWRDAMERLYPHCAQGLTCTPGTKLACCPASRQELH